MGRSEMASARVSKGERVLLTVAAKIEGQTLSSFVREAAIREAEKRVLTGLEPSP
jgi:uncharacterized protein (DUF1778 family)